MTTGVRAGTAPLRGSVARAAPTGRSVWAIATFSPNPMSSSAEPDDHHCRPREDADVVSGSVRAPVAPRDRRCSLNGSRRLQPVMESPSRPGRRLFGSATTRARSTDATRARGDLRHPRDAPTRQSRQRGAPTGRATLTATSAGALGGAETAALTTGTGNTHEASDPSAWWVRVPVPSNSANWSGLGPRVDRLVDDRLT